MRISGGKARGIPLKSSHSKQLRPASDALRQAVFNSLGPLVEEARVLDLFAGTGAYGLEALSRGAASSTFLELDRRTLPSLRMNIQAVTKSCGIANTDAVCSIHSVDVFRWQPPEGQFFDLIFCDPPYANIPEWKVPLFSRASRWLAPGPNARFCLEFPHGTLLDTSEWTPLRILGSNTKGAPCIGIFAKTDTLA